MNRLQIDLSFTIGKARYPTAESSNLNNLNNLNQSFVPPPTGITRAYLCSHPDQHQWHLCFGLVCQRSRWLVEETELISLYKWIIRWSSSGLLFFPACFWFLLNLMLPEKEIAFEFKNISPVKVPHKQRTHQVSIKYRSSIGIVKWNVLKRFKMWANFPSIRISEESKGSLSAVSQLRSRQRSYSLASQLGLDSLNSWLWPHFQALRPYGPTLKGPGLFRQAIYRYVIGMSLWECYMRFRSCTFVMYTMYINRCAMCVSQCVQDTICWYIDEPDIALYNLKYNL